MKNLELIDVLTPDIVFGQELYLPKELNIELSQKIEQELIQELTELSNELGWELT